MDNKSLIQLLQGNQNDRDAALKFLYMDETLRAQTRKVALAVGARPDLLDDLFMETLVCFDRSIRLGRFDGKSHWRTWFVAIAKWGSLARKKRDNRLVFNELPNAFDRKENSPEDIFIQSEQRELFENAISKMSEKCRALLEMERLRFSMAEVAAARNYANANVAKKEMSLCKSRLRHFLENSPAFQEMMNDKWLMINGH